MENKYNKEINKGINLWLELKKTSSNAISSDLKVKIKRISYLISALGNYSSKNMYFS